MSFLALCPIPLPRSLLHLNRVDPESLQPVPIHPPHVLRMLGQGRPSLPQIDISPYPQSLRKECHQNRLHRPRHTYSVRHMFAGTLLSRRSIAGGCCLRCLRRRLRVDPGGRESSSYQYRYHYMNDGDCAIIILPTSSS